MKEKLKRADFMSVEHRRVLQGVPRSHFNCQEATKSLQNPGGISRPGKTKHDKATGAWASKSERVKRHEARRNALQPATQKR